MPSFQGPTRGSFQAVLSRRRAWRTMTAREPGASDSGLGGRWFTARKAWPSGFKTGLPSAPGKARGADMATATTIRSRKGFQGVSLTRRRAIRERCLNCSGWSSPEMEGCSFTDCELFLYRTGKGKQPAKARNQAIKSYCRWCANGSSKGVALCPAETCPLHIYRIHGI